MWLAAVIRLKPLRTHTLVVIGLLGLCAPVHGGNVQYFSRENTLQQDAVAFDLQHYPTVAAASLEA